MSSFKFTVVKKLVSHLAELECSKRNWFLDFLHLSELEYVCSVSVLWNVYGDCENYSMMTGHTGAILQLQYSRDGRYNVHKLAGTCAGGYVRRQVRTPVGTYAGGYVHQRVRTPAGTYTSGYVRRQVRTPAGTYAGRYVRRQVRTPAGTYTSGYVRRQVCTRTGMRSGRYVC